MLKQGMLAALAIFVFAGNTAAQQRGPVSIAGGGFPLVTNADPGTKICSPVDPAHWRALMPVPNDWTIADCRAYAASMLPPAYQIGCIFKTGEKYSWSTEIRNVNDANDPVRPPRDCW